MRVDSLREPQPILVCDLFPELRARLLDLLDGLSATEWNLPTSAAMWSVKDIALHLLAGDIGILSRKRDGFSQPGAALETWDDLVKFINALNQSWVEAARRLSTRVLCDLLAHLSPQVEAYFASLDPYALGDSVSWAGSGPAPVWLDIAREYTERWHHQQQIRDAAGRSGLYEERLFAPVLETFVRALPHTFRRVDAAPGTAVQLLIQGAAGGQWCVRKTSSAWELLLGTDSNAAARVTIASEDAWKIFTRGLRGDEARKRVGMEGNPKLAHKVIEMVSVIA